MKIFSSLFNKKIMTPVVAKAKSHDFLKSNLIEINESLPLIETLEESNPQNAQSVALRIVVLNHIIRVGYGADAKSMKESLEKFNLFQYASAREQNLLSRSEHTQQEKINATWHTECVQSLAWCLGLVGLNPFSLCDKNLVTHFPEPFIDPSNFVSAATLRSLDEIYEQVDLHYRLHWAVRNAQLSGRQTKLVGGLISERRKALDWVIGVESNWDEIPLDT
jgi:hypothetical protein